MNEKEDNELRNNFASWLDKNGVNLISTDISLQVWTAEIDINKLKAAFLSWHENTLEQSVREARIDDFEVKTLVEITRKATYAIEQFNKTLDDIADTHTRKGHKKGKSYYAGI